MTEKNPLEKYFRKSGMTIDLPSKGYWYDENVVDGDITNIEIFPMTAKDELILKNPDALLSGKALESILQSCAPQIKNVSKLVSLDLDVLFLAIRNLTYGNSLDLDSKCSKCGTENSYSLDVEQLIANAGGLEPPFIVELEKDLIVHVRPFTFANQMEASTAAFNETKTLQALEASTAENKEELMKKLMNNSFDTLSNLKAKLVADCIMKIEITEGENTNDIINKDQIIEFLSNSHRKYMDSVDKEIVALNEKSINNQEKTFVCINEECKHEWTSPVEINPVHFFG